MSHTRVRRVLLVAVLLLLTACEKQEVLPPVPPAPDDLSTWRIPTPWTPPPRPVPPPPLPPRPAGPNEQVYAFEPSKAYEVLVPLGFPTDVLLEPGETVHNIIGGDRTPLAEGQTPTWEIKEGKSEQGDRSMPHIFLSASKADARMGLVITTSKRTYYLTARSLMRSPVRAVRWTYPPEPPRPEPKAEPGLFPDATQPQRYHIGYVISGSEHTPDWHPRWIGDEGHKTYLLFSPVVLATELPLVREIGPQGPAVLNTRLVGPVLIIDKLVGRLDSAMARGSRRKSFVLREGHYRPLLALVIHNVPCFRRPYPRQDSFSRKVAVSCRTCPKQAQMEKGRVPWPPTACRVPPSR